MILWKIFATVEMFCKSQNMVQHSLPSADGDESPSLADKEKWSAQIDKYFLEKSEPLVVAVRPAEMKK